jgi:hypothetical protein
MQDTVIVQGTLYLLTAQQVCWKCRAEQPVIALATQRLSDEGSPIEHTNDDLVLLSNIVAMPAEVLAYMRTRHSGFESRFSNAAGHSYFSNTCECGALFGDFYLHGDPGGAFFPETEEEAAKVTLTSIPIAPPLQFDCACHYGSVGELILAHARRLS